MDVSSDFTIPAFGRRITCIPSPYLSADMNSNFQSAWVAVMGV
jgi:hypothetical protein